MAGRESFGDRIRNLPLWVRIGVPLALALMILFIVIGAFIRSSQAESDRVRADYELAWIDYQAGVSEWDALVARAADLADTCEVDTGAVPGKCSALTWIADADTALDRASKVDVEDLADEDVKSLTGELRERQALVQAEIEDYEADLSAVEATIDLQGQAWRNEALKPELERSQKVVDLANQALELTEGENQAVVEKVKELTDDLQAVLDETNERIDEIRISEGRDLVTSLSVARTELEAQGRLLGSWPSAKPNVRDLQTDRDQNEVGS